jgi:hypothetical protein
MGRDWSAGVAKSTADWIDGGNRHERDAYRAYTALQKALRPLREYFRKYPGDKPFLVLGQRVAIREGAFAERDHDPTDDTPGFSNHGMWLSDFRPFIERILLLKPWLLEKRGPYVWESRNMIVQIYDKEYNPGVLRRRSPGATSDTRMTVTELAWHSILHGNWPGLKLGSRAYKAEDVVNREAKDVADARTRLAEQRAREEARVRKLLDG